MIEQTLCPKCEGDHVVKSGVVNNKQRYLCKKCQYYFSVNKIGKKINNYYVIKALQLYLEGLSLREIERVLGVSHATISNWVKEANLKKPDLQAYDPSYKILSYAELQDYVKDESVLKDRGLMITELGNKYLIIRWNKTTGE